MFGKKAFHFHLDAYLHTCPVPLVKTSPCSSPVGKASSQVGGTQGMEGHERTGVASGTGRDQACVRTG